MSSCQKDKDIIEAKNSKNKIIGVTCHNSIKLAKAMINGANYIAIGAFYKTKTKKVAKADIYKIKTINLPVIAIGGINENNYKNYY